MKGFMSMFFVFFALTVLLIPPTSSQEVSDSDRVLNFLEEVVIIDVSRYNVTFVPSESSFHFSYFKFESSSSSFDVMYDYQNNELNYLALGTVEGTPLYTEPLPNSILETADQFLQRYQSFTGEDFQQKRDILDNITKLEDTTITQENLIFNFQYGQASQLHTDNSTTFEWVNLINGAPFTTIYVSFQDGHFVHLFDSQRVFKSGSTEVNVSREEAIAITKETAENWSEVIKVGNETILVSNLTILDEPVDASLYFRSREAYTLYPCWDVTVHADKIHPDIGLSFKAEIWADTGETITNYLVVGSTIPEFPSWILLPLFLTATLAAVIYRKRLTKNRAG